MTVNETAELKDSLFDTALALEEMIVFQEGKMPMRLASMQSVQGYHEARKVVLNDARAQLRRVKTHMLRAGVIRNKVNPDGTFQAAEAGKFAATVEKGQDRSGHVRVDRIERQAQPERNHRRFGILLFLIAGYIVGFWYPWLHTVLAGLAVGFWGMRLYWKIVGVRIP